MLAANRTPLPQACGARRTPCAEVSAAIRRISVMPPARATSGCAISSAALKQILEVEPGELALPRGNRDCRRSAHLCLTSVIVGRDRLLEPSDVVGLKFLGKFDGGRNLKRAVRVDHQFDLGAKTAASRLHSAHTVEDREAVTSHHPHLGSREALRGV